jgi:choline monooxygenase
MNAPPSDPPPFTVEPDIRQALGPPSAMYTADGYYQLQRRTVFRSSWQLIGHVHQLVQDGAQLPATFMPGSVDEPIALVRDGDTVRALANVCTHRGKLLVEEPTCQRRIHCGYHGRRFRLDGACEHMPGFDEVLEFPAPSDHLRRWSLERWGPLLFAALEPEVSWQTWIAPLRTRLAHLPLDLLVYASGAQRSFELATNWALYCDNYLEGMHIPYVHPALHRALDAEAYTTELSDHAVLQVGRTRDEGSFDPTIVAGSPDAGQAIAGYYLWLYPTTMLNFYPWGLSINRVEPRGVGATRVHYDAYVWNQALRATGAGADLTQVEREDDAVVESVFRGLQSSTFTRARYSPSGEPGVHHFHRMLASSMFGA